MKFTDPTVTFINMMIGDYKMRISISVIKDSTLCIRFIILCKLLLILKELHRILSALSTLSIVMQHMFGALI